MTENKTKPTKLSVSEFIAAIPDPVKRSDCQQLAKLMRRITGNRARMWGSSIVGFGQYHYQYESGREGDMMLVGFAPRKQNLVIYIVSGFEDHDELMSGLGKFKTGKSCLYVKRLCDIDNKILAQLIERSVKHLNQKYS